MANIKVNTDENTVRISDHRANLLSSYMSDIEAGNIDAEGLQTSSKGHVKADTIVTFEGNPSKATMELAARQARTDLVNAIRKGQPAKYERDEANSEYASARKAHTWLTTKATFDQDLGRYVFHITPENPVPFDTSKPDIVRAKVKKLLQKHGIEDPTEEQIDETLEDLS